MTREVEKFVQEVEFLKEKEEFLLKTATEVKILETYSKIESSPTHFYSLIRESKLRDEELLAFAYLNHLGKAYLLHGWQTEHEIEQIKEWEKSFSLTNFLSYYYNRVIDRLDLRKLIEPSAFTSHGNIKEYSLREDFRQDILNFPVDISEKIDLTLDKYKKIDDLPF